MPTNWKDMSYISLFVVVNRLTKIFKPVQKIDALWFLQLNCPWLRVLIPLVSLLSSTVVTTSVSSMRTSNNLMIAYRKNF